MNQPRLILLPLAALCGLLLCNPAQADPPIDFAREIQPILADNCYFCHGPDKNHRTADLRFDILDPKQGPFAPRDDYSIITPGKLDDSVLIMRLTSDDPDFQMPPPKANRHVTPKQIDLLKKWVEQGAKWGKHWALEPPIRSALPEVKDATWVKNPLDRFILARLEKEGLKPSPEASKETLIRRVTLDLTGLPPTPEQVDAFLADPSSDAYEKVVDRLLASPRYGERMVWEWLDIARYADTNGYQNDPTRTSWPWRDWVIKALNENLPYDQFIIWQLAGDLLPNATQEQRLASAFNRNHPFNGEGGRIPEETRVDNVMDRVDTTATAFMGLTVGCAKCHDHKFDPISQKEYYQLYAYFNQCSETGEGKYVNEGNVSPVMTLVSEQQSQKLALLKKQAKDAAEKLTAQMPEVDKKQVEWEIAARYEKGWIVATPLSAKASSGATMKTLPDSSILVGGTNPDTDVHEVVLRSDLARITALRLEAIPDPSLPEGGPGRSPSSGNFVLNNLEAAAVSLADPKQTKPIIFASTDATFSQEGFPVAGAVDADPKTGWAVWKAPDKKNISAVFRFAEPVTFSAGCSITLKFHYESPVRLHTMGRFRLALSDASAPTPSVAAALAVAANERTDEQKKQIRDFYRGRISTELKTLNQAAAAAKKAAEDFENAFTKVMVMDDATTRPTHVLSKGAYDKRLDEVHPGVPAVLNPLPRDGQTTSSPRDRERSGSVAGPPTATRPTTHPTNNRLTLARWLTDPANPLTARVTVNRYWQQFFGTGIVKTVEDFGLQGERPVHPELLDWLALQFRDGSPIPVGATLVSPSSPAASPGTPARGEPGRVGEGWGEGRNPTNARTQPWNVKALHRLIVTSAAYRQSSKVSPDLFDRDPENRLLARGPRFRLPSAFIRDQALAAAGLLVEKVGGAPLKGYQPPGIWEEATFNIIKYQQDHGEALYRRSVYTFWRRIVGPTEFFDTASRSSCVARPSRTNTPLHALTTLNDVTYIEAARALAQRVMTKTQSPEERLRMICRLVLGRSPHDTEKPVLFAALDRLKNEYAANKPEALKLLLQGESKRDEKLDPCEHAAYTALCLEILNLDETLTKE